MWSWDGRAWQQLDGSGPPAAVVAGVACDPERRTPIRYGGPPLGSSGCLTETWQWSDGS